MSRKRTWLGLMAWVVAASLGCSACEERAREQPVSTPEKEEPEMEVLEIPLEPQPRRQGNRLMELAGKVDGENRYLPAVMVTALSGDEAEMHCSGTTLGRRVVLTAGHCLCPRRQLTPRNAGHSAVIDASMCFDSVHVEMVVYEPQAQEGATLRASSTTVHSGRAEPHPSLRVVLDDQGHVLSSHADLALIFLSEPLELSGLPLDDQEVRVGDPIIIAGYEYDEMADVFGRERRFSLNKVTRLATAEDERVLIQQPGGHRYRLDSGGPCLRQGATGLELVGISSRWLGQGAACTSLLGYRGWLDAAVRRAEAPRPLQK